MPVAHSLDPSSGRARRFLRRGDRRNPWLTFALAAAVLLAMRVPWLPPTLEDIDSVNFAMALEDFNPVAHRPHPPGYPVFVLLAAIARPLFAETAPALAFVSALMAALLVAPLFLLLRTLLGRAGGASLASALVLFCPVVVFNSVRPMSDLTGLFAVTLAQCLVVVALVREESGREQAGRERPSIALWAAAAVACGIAPGTRLQAIFLVGPILLYAFVRARRVRGVLAAGFGAGVLAWLVPVLWQSGGPGAYLTSLQGLVADALPVEPLLGRFSWTAAKTAAWKTFGAPWHLPIAAWLVLAFAVAGVVQLARRGRRELAWLLLLFAPYTLYHYFLQWTETLRYSIPIVPMVACLAAIPLGALARRAGVLPSQVAVAFAFFASLLMYPALRDFHQQPSPPFQALARAQELAAAESGAVLSGHFRFRRYLEQLPGEVEVLPPDLGREWRALTEYWKAGGRAPVFFLRNPVRTSLLLVDPTVQSRLEEWRWPDTVMPFMSGERPREAQLSRLDPPRWFCESGFLVSLEAGPIDEVAREPHVMYVRASHEPQVLIVGGTTRGVRGPASVGVRVGGTVVQQKVVEAAFAIGTVVPAGAGPIYLPVSIESDAPLVLSDVTLSAAGAPAIRPFKGFYFPERDEGQRLFRWMGREASALVHLPSPKGRLVIDGRLPVRGYGGPVTLHVTWAAQPLGPFVVNGREFRVECPLERVNGSDWGELTVSTSHDFVPDEAFGNGDRRALSLRIYGLRVEDAEHP